MISISDSTKEKLYNTITDSASTPYPAWIFGSALIARGLTIQPAMKGFDGTSGGSFKFSQSLATARPTKLSCYLFGAAHLLGGWITYDGDVINGSGFNFAWSTLYLIVNGRSGLKSVFYGRINPLALSTLALGNVGLYGKKFFWP